MVEKNAMEMKYTYKDQPPVLLRDALHVERIIHFYSLRKRNDSIRAVRHISLCREREVEQREREPQVFLAHLELW